MTLQEQIDTSIRAVCPIDGVSFRDVKNKATWRIDFSDAATVDQRKAAQAVIDTFDLANFQSTGPASPTKQLADLLASKNIITAQDAATFEQAPVELAL